MAQEDNFRGKGSSNGFKQNPQNTYKYGRPKKSLTLVLEELKAQGFEPAKKNQIIDTFEVLLILDQEALQNIVNDQTKAMLLRIIAKQMLGGKGNDMIERMLDRAHGRPTQREEISGTLNSPMDLSAEKEKALEKLIKKQVGKLSEPKQKKISTPKK